MRYSQTVSTLHSVSIFSSSYFVHAVNLLVTDTYEIVYFTSAVDGKNMPSHAWIKQCYDMLEYRYIVFACVYFAEQIL